MSTRYTIHDLMTATGASETATRRYLRSYEANHSNVRMRDDNNVWSLNSTTFRSLARTITNRRAALGVS